MVRTHKPAKKSDRELTFLLYEAIINKHYVFSSHAKARLKDRTVSDLAVLDILMKKKGRLSRRNRSKDKYEPPYNDWNYCIEGIDYDEADIRIIFTFDENDLLIVTVIRLS